MENGNLDRYFNQIDSRLGRIESSLDKISESHEDRTRSVEVRVAALELKGAAQGGGIKMLSIIAGAAATIGGIVSHFIGRIWS